MSPTTPALTDWLRAHLRALHRARAFQETVSKADSFQPRTSGFQEWLRQYLGLEGRFGSAVASTHYETFRSRAQDFLSGKPLKGKSPPEIVQHFTSPLLEAFSEETRFQLSELREPDRILRIIQLAKSGELGASPDRDLSALGFSQTDIERASKPIGPPDAGVDESLPRWPPIEFVSEPADARLPSAALPAPERLFAGRYELLKPYDPGKQGKVFLALDRANEGQKVAIKLIEDGEEKADRRLNKEVPTVRKIDSENVIKILNSNAGEQSITWEGANYWFYTMPVMDGSLAGIRTGFPGWWDSGVGLARQLLTGILRGASEAHAKGIIHRDLKPENVLLRNNPLNAPSAVVSDFGLLKDTESESTHGTGGEHVGSRYYTAPEIDDAPKKDRHSKYTAQSDLYGIGQIAVFLANGEPCTVRKVADTLIEISQSPFESLVPLIEALCQEDPVSRPSSADQAAQFLRGKPSGVPRRASSAPTLESDTRRTRRAAISTFAAQVNMDAAPFFQEVFGRAVAMTKFITAPMNPMQLGPGELYDTVKALNQPFLDGDIGFPPGCIFKRPTWRANYIMNSYKKVAAGRTVYAGFWAFSTDGILAVHSPIIDDIQPPPGLRSPGFDPVWHIYLLQAACYWAAALLKRQPTPTDLYFQVVLEGVRDRRLIDSDGIRFMEKMSQVCLDDLISLPTGQILAPGRLVDPTELTMRLLRDTLALFQYPDADLEPFREHVRRIRGSDESR